MMIARYQELGFFERHRRFKEGREDVEDDPGVGSHPQAEQIKMLSVWEKKCRRRNVGMIAGELGMNSKRVGRIITEDLPKEWFLDC